MKEVYGQELVADFSQYLEEQLKNDLTDEELKLAFEKADSSINTYLNENSWRYIEIRRKLAEQLKAINNNGSNNTNNNTNESKTN